MKLGGFIPNKKTHGYFPLSFNEESRWGLLSTIHRAGEQMGHLGSQKWPEFGWCLEVQHLIERCCFFLDVCQWSFFLKFLPRFQIACCENPMSIGLFFFQKKSIHFFPSSILYFIYQCHNKGFFAGRLFSWHQRLSPEVSLQRWTLIAKAPASSMRCLSSDEKNGFRVAMTVNKKGSGSIGFDFVWKFNHHI